MIYALVWKEYRTQWMTWVALALVAVASLFGLPVVMAPGGLANHPDVRMSLQFLAGALAWTYGLICGAMLLAGERETGTLSFLDMLPGFRRRLWFAKLLGGVLLLAAQIAVLEAAAVAAGLFENGVQAALDFDGMVCFGLYGLAWGMLFSAFGRSVMNMILLALAVLIVAAPTSFFLSAMAVGTVASLLGVLPSSPASQAVILPAACGLIVLLTVPAALAVSALRFTRIDRGRLRPVEPPVRARRGKPRVAWSVLFWLAGRQARFFAAGMAAFALLLGFLTMADPVVLWPVFTLLAGVLCGATAFLDEQQGPFRFLGDQRFPLGRYWLVKVGLRFLIAAGAALLILLPSVFVAIVQAADREAPFRPAIIPVAVIGGYDPVQGYVTLGLILTMWLVHGFVAGLLCGVLFRHGLAAGVFGLVLGVVLSAVWVPSLLEGGLHAWQVFGAPALLLLSTLFLLRPWAAGRIVSWTTAKRLAPLAALALLWIAAGLWARVLEIPAVPTKYDLAAFRSALPAPEQNKAGDLIRSACFQFDELSRSLPAGGPPAAGGAPAGAAAPGVAPGQPAARPPLDDRALQALQDGWPAGNGELADYIAKLSAGEWRGRLQEAADLPPGMVEDLRNATLETAYKGNNPARWMGVVLALDGLRRQSAGDDEAFVEDLRLGLTLAGALRHHAPTLEVLSGQAVESSQLHGLGQWLRNLKGRPDLLHRALDLLSDYLLGTGPDEADQHLVNYLIARNSMDDPLPWLQRDFSSEQGPRVRDAESARREAEWVTLVAALVPWEHERQERLLHVVFNTPTDKRQGLLRRLPQSGPVSRYLYFMSTEADRCAVRPDLQCQERAMLLELALRWYQAESGKPAESLDVLVPKYLTAIPADPYDGKPFRYRLSRGEEIVWPEDQPPPGPAPAPAVPPQPMQPQAAVMPPGPPPAPPPHTRKVPPGQGILWSVGPDRTDDGGKRQKTSNNDFAAPGEDIIFLVPLPKSK